MDFALVVSSPYYLVSWFMFVLMENTLSRDKWAWLKRCKTEVFTHEHNNHV